MLFFASAIAEQAATTTVNLGFLTALSGLIAAIVAAATFYMATRSTRNKESAAVKAVDAEAYQRGVEIYEATLATGVDKLRRESYAELNKEIADLRNKAAKEAK